VGIRGITNCSGVILFPNIILALSGKREKWDIFWVCNVDKELMFMLFNPGLVNKIVGWVDPRKPNIFR
jgi:hypothetical protein